MPNVFAIESFMTSSRPRRIDPVAFRLAHIKTSASAP